MICPYRNLGTNVSWQHLQLSTNKYILLHYMLVLSFIHTMKLNSDFGIAFQFLCAVNTGKHKQTSPNICVILQPMRMANDLDLGVQLPFSQIS